MNEYCLCLHEFSAKPNSQNNSKNYDKFVSRWTSSWLLFIIAKKLISSMYNFRNCYPLEFITLVFNGIYLVNKDLTS